MITFFQALILGIVEGITEFLPISSTAHLDIATKLLGIPPSDFVSTFMIVIQLGAIMAVAYIFFKQIIFSKDLAFKMIVGFLPIGFAGYFLYPYVKYVLLGNILVEIIAIAIGGIAFIYFENKVPRSENEYHDKATSLTTIDFLKLGCWQVLALIPGISRSGSVLIGGMAHGMPLSKLVNTTFLLAIPTIVVASGYDLLQTGISFSMHEWLILAFGTVVSGIVAFFVAQYFMKYMNKPGSLKTIGWYRIILAALLIVIFF